MTDKRPRGRPKGTGKKDDRHLDAVADLLVRKSELKKTPAISQIVQKAFPQHQWEAAERRLLRKWNKTAEERLEAASERYAEERRERRVARTLSSGSLFPNKTGVFADLAAGLAMSKQMQDIIDPPALRFLREQEKEMQRFRDMIDPPFMRQIREQSELMKKAFGHF